jgi:multidrug efflux pump subunit AcrA (membrane-fusion protein)
MPRPVLIVLILTAAAFSVRCTQSKTTQDGKREQLPKVVKTEAVRQDSVRRSVEVVGTLAAEAEVTVSSQVEGVVDRVLADLGDRVRAGQTLVELDREKLQYSLDEQKATHSRALTRYGVSEPGTLPPVEQTPDVRRAAAELAQAKQNHDRAGELHRRRLISQQALEDAETDLRLKTAAYDSALQNARNLRADIDASDATMKLADRSLRDAFIRAPFDGYVQKRIVSAGELVKAQMPVMTVVRVDPLKLTAEIPERMAPWIQVGQSLDFRVDAFRDQTFPATISRISPAVTTQTRSFAFEAAAPNENGRLKPGTFARVHLETALVETVLTVPYGAMQYRYGVYRVFTVDGDHLTAHELKTGDRVGDRMEILDGVKLGQLVALTDVDNLADGMKVTIERDTE